MNTKDIPGSVREIAERLAQPRPMRRGSLSVRFVKCNKLGCACAKDPEARHGPYTSVVRTVGKKTRSRRFPAAQTEVLRRQIDAGKNFRKEIEAYWQSCEQWADEELEATEAISQEDTKKRASKRPSKRKSLPRSKHS
ncbi:MAG TPA: hypothetical protein DCO77_02030 [Nitrospiraceae bacterium]|nr:hypothetical protein [Nitrospiraceae bacterium]